MNFLKRLSLTIFMMIVALVLLSFLFPQKQHVERSIDISAPVEKIYPYLSNPKLFSQWSPWSKIDPNMKVQYIGATSGKGAIMKWQSDQASVGNGSWTIVNAVENQSINIDMDFGNQGIAKSNFLLKPSGNATQVIWGFDTDAGMNPVMRWMGLLMDKMVGTEYEKGLEELKLLIEKQ